MPSPLLRAAVRAAVPVALPIVALLLAACGGETTAPQPGLRIVTLATGSDTVMALPTELLMVEVRDDAGAPVAGARVEFRSPVAAGAIDPSRRPMFVCDRALAACAQFGTNGSSLRFFAEATTDAEGRASARVQHGTVAAAGSIEVTVPARSLGTTASFTTRPGALARIAAATKDTAVLVGHAIQPGATAADRFGNARSEAVTLEALQSGVVSVSGGTIIGLAFGRVGVAARAGGVTDTIFVGVVPAGRLAIGRASDLAGQFELVLTNTDGSARRSVGVTRGHVGFAWPSWSGDGRVLFQETMLTGSSAHTFAFDTTTGARSAVVDTAAFAFSMGAAYARSGGGVYFYGQQKGSTETGIFRAGVEGSAPHLVVARAAGPSPSPDGTRLAYADFATGTVVVRDLATGGTTSIASSPYSPFWSPSGDRIAYLATNASNTLELWVVRPDGSERRRISDVYTASSWSPDGDWIAIITAGVGVELVRVADGLRIPVPGARSAMQVSWRP